LIIKMTHIQKILILDFGSQYSQLIARRVRENGVYCEIYPYTMTDDKILAYAPNGVILSGGAESVTVDFTPRIPLIIFNLNCPVLGICYGMQSMAQQLGGKVITGKKREYGSAKLIISDNSLFSNTDVWMSHGDQVSEVPDKFSIIASTENCPIAAMVNEEKGFYGLQFHPEVEHTKEGKQIFEKFISICKITPKWISKNIIEEQIVKIQEKVGSDNVLLGLSGGVDSSVTAVLLHKAIMNQLVCVFVDTGLLRLNEQEDVKMLFNKHFGIKLICVDAKERFYEALEGISDPEEKRKVIGKKFIEIFEIEAEKIPNIKWLAQGTIYPDVIESVGHVIKSHHNVGGLPKNMKLGIIEPLRELFKDEVRKIGVELGLPYELIHRHPFPGPGLAVKILGEVKMEYVQKLRLADAILIDELYKHELYYKVSQAFAVFLPIKSVGVIGDARQYDHVIALRIVETIDFMTARWSHMPYEFLETVSNRIINEVKGISRITYDISNKPPATIEWE
jgi:GMP synthase (glutamine-hydrolysing)